MQLSDVELLKVLYSNKCDSEIKGFTINKILELSNVSHTKIRNTLQAMLLAEFVCKGMKDMKAETYYITKRGIDKLKLYM